MLFEFSAEQYQLRDAVAGVLQSRNTAAHLRAQWDSPADVNGFDPWQVLAEIGFTSLLAATEQGGFGGTWVDLVLPLEQLGRFAVTDRLGECAGVVVPLLAEIPAAADVLKKIVTGEARTAVRLLGQQYVPGGLEADLTLVVMAQEVHLVPQERVTGAAVASQDPTRLLAACSYRMDRSTLLSSSPAAVKFCHRAALTSCAVQLVGVCQTLLDHTVEYVKTREQFGRRIGSFQAVKHQLADAAVQLETARSLCWYAACELAGSSGEAAPAHLAKAASAQASRTVNHVALQLHGGIGFTWEFDLHRWLQRGKALERQYGSAAEHHEILGTKFLEMADTP